MVAPSVSNSKGAGYAPFDLEAAFTEQRKTLPIGGVASQLEPPRLACRCPLFRGDEQFGSNAETAVRRQQASRSNEYGPATAGNLGAVTSR